MNGNDTLPEGIDADLIDAVTVARDLLGRLSDKLAARADGGEAPALLRKTQDVLSRLAATGSTAAPAVDRPKAMLLDVSDLLGYFENNRLPTGIQRVQAELIFNILQSADQATGLCCFVESRDQWVEVDSARFKDICLQSRMAGDSLEPRWMAAIQDLKTAIAESPAMEFPYASVLVNIGTSWWLPNYFLYVRQAKIAASVRYVPLIYDLIPALTPENCDPQLVQEFIGWLVGVLDHADFFLTISEATRRDLMDFAEKLGRPIAAERVAVVPLDADFRAAETQSLPEVRRFAEPFVLFVSTLEARKNQLGALDTWARLIARHGPDKIPRLVLVGKQGFKSDLISHRLGANADLRERVSILSGIEDVELQALYRDCLFTIYPSTYEGWGLPVTESLCYGKVPLIADNSSLPEAGGCVALYFPTGSTVAMSAAVERLVFEKDYRTNLEDVIRRDFHPRSWAEVAAGFTSHVRRWIENPPVEWRAPSILPNTYYPLRRNSSRRVWPGMGSAEPFRYGLGWFRVEDSGCLTHQSGAELELRLSGAAVRRLGFEIYCPECYDVSYRIELIDRSDVFVAGHMGDGNPRWVFLDLPDLADDTAIQIRLATTILFAPEIGWKGDFRTLGIGLKGIFALGSDAAARMSFIEAAALGALSDLDFYRDRSFNTAAS